MEPGSSTTNALRLQAAAVAAQQAALSEEEAKLVQRRSALEKQEEQLAAHLEEKRRKLVELSERTQAERLALEQERAAHARYAETVLASGKQVAAERKRLALLQRRIRQRWQRFWIAERQKHERKDYALATAERALEGQAARLQQKAHSLADQRLRFHTVYELGRCRLREAWQELRRQQYLWKHRRGKERAALKVREHAIDHAEHALLDAQQLFLRHKQAWDNAQALSAGEHGGVDARVKNQRLKILEQQAEIGRLDAEILARQSRLAELADHAASSRPADARAPAPGWSRPFLALQAMRAREAEQSTASSAVVPSEDSSSSGCADLQRLATTLADQRGQLVEHWCHLSTLQDDWDKARHQAARELDILAQQLVDRGRLVLEREEASRHVEGILHHRHEELSEVRRQLIAWRARLQARENAWQGERLRLLAELSNRAELADRHRGTLDALRQRWSLRRNQELEAVRAERQELELLRKEHDQQRLVLAEQTTALYTQQRVLAEKALALAQYRQELLAKVPAPNAERRLERLRRRLIMVHATAIRTAVRERAALRSALLALASRRAEFHELGESLARRELELLEQQTAWEHRQAQADNGQTRADHDLQNAHMQRNLAEQQLVRLRDQIEHIASALFDEPDPPAAQALTRAA